MQKEVRIDVFNNKYPFINHTFIHLLNPENFLPWLVSLLTFIIMNIYEYDAGPGCSCGSSYFFSLLESHTGIFNNLRFIIFFLCNQKLCQNFIYTSPLPLFSSSMTSPLNSIYFDTFYTNVFFVPRATIFPIQIRPLYELGK